MLGALSIKDIVLIDRLELTFSPGLSVLTGETGAGKSILLDALGLALGGRADRALIRAGAERAAVSAVFEPGPSHAAWDIIRDQGLEIDPGEPLILRRILDADGRSRAFVNDAPVGVGLLRDLGDLLVEIHGQHDDRGLLNPAAHRRLLDAYGGLDEAAAGVRRVHVQWRAAADAVTAEESKLNAARAEEEFLRFAVNELAELAPVAGEEARLSARRTLLQQGEKLRGSLHEILSDLTRDHGADAALRGALRRLERMTGAAGEIVAPVLAPLERAAVEAAEAIALLEEALAAIGADPTELERVEERLFSLRAAARKHQVQVDDLPALAQRMADELRSLDQGAERLDVLKKAERQARAAFIDAAARLRDRRRRAATALDAAVNKELRPLKLEKARFFTRIDHLPEAEWSAEGGERVEFEVTTNPGAPSGPLMKIASGGEQSRFILALKVVLAARGSAPTLVFDEVDRGVGGAVADAVGERLARLARNAQVLVVTHSPQVAAAGEHHWRILKRLRAAASGQQAVTEVAALDRDARQEEIARMLAGAKVTDEARAAAARLMQR
ncbi:MAG: DNA repair protein RecN [Proteobacteria bacterium]|nr:MAG: DNA repair protein RecN [Pseudomonadota bacterium]